MPNPFNLDLFQFETSLESKQAPREITQVLPYDGQAWLYPNVFEALDIQTLLDTIDWQKQQLYMYDKWVEPKRRVCLYSDQPLRDGACTHQVVQWPTALKKIARSIYQSHEEQFNAVLCNLYRNGVDYVGWHSDDETNMDQSCIASVTFGAQRSFKFRHNSTKEQVSVELKHGDLLLMRFCQKEWQHTLPKRLQVNEPRINLTFRRIL